MAKLKSDPRGNHSALYEVKMEKKTGLFFIPETLSYLVVQMNDGPECAKFMDLKKSNHQLPLVGAALALHNDPEGEAGQLFCTLPLPVDKRRSPTTLVQVRLRGSGSVSA